MLEWALWYASFGWHVFPVHTVQDGECSCGIPNCANVGKHPRTRNGVLDATTSQGKIDLEWTWRPDSNIGIATGPSGLVVLDIDPRHGGDESYWRLQSELGRSLFETVTALTGGGGQHLVYRGQAKSGANLLGEGIDIRSTGGYIVVSPSLHVSGRRYEWEAGWAPRESPVLDIPAELVQRLATGTKKLAGAIPEDNSPIADGQRNVVLTQWAGSFRRRGMNATEIVAALTAINANRCKPPLHEAELRTIAASVARYTPEEPLETMVAQDTKPLSVEPEPVGNALLRLWANPIIDTRRYTTSLPHLDSVTNMLHPGEMTVIGAWTGVGKSGFATQFALEVGKQYKVLFFPLELGVLRTQVRMLAQLMKTDEDWILGQQERGQLEELYPMQEELASRQIEMLAPPVGEMFGYREIRDIIKKQKPDVVIVDHLQHIDDWTPASNKRSDLNAAKIVRDIHQLADSERFHIMLVSQLKAEKIKKGQRPELYDFADTAALPRVADNVWALHRPYRGYPREDTIAEVLVLKNRRGPEPWIHTHYVGKSMSLLPMTREEATIARCCLTQ